MVFLCETRLPVSRLERIKNQCGMNACFGVDAVGTKGGLAMMWKEEITLSLRSFSQNHIDMNVETDNESDSWRITGFYGEPVTHLRDRTWNLLSNLGND